jgi:hypothetical protein
MRSASFVGGQVVSGRLVVVLKFVLFDDDEIVIMGVAF